MIRRLRRAYHRFAVRMGWRYSIPYEIAKATKGQQIVQDEPQGRRYKVEGIAQSPVVLGAHVIRFEDVR